MDEGSVLASSGARNKKWVYGDLITTLWDIDNDGNEVYQPCYIYQEQSLAM